MGEPRAAVVITSKNRSELLTLALCSVQRQDIRDWECIVVDEGSTDDSVAVAQSFAEIDPRIRVVRHERSLGLAAARNSGLGHVRAPYICFLDDDDLMLPSALSARLAVLSGAAPDVAGAYCDWKTIDYSAGLEVLHTQRKGSMRTTIAFGDLARGTPFISSAPLLKTEVLTKLGGFDEGFSRAEDAEMWLRVCRAGFSFAYARYTGIAYRRTPNSLVTGTPMKQLEALLEVARRADQPADAHTSRDQLGPLSKVAYEQAQLPQILKYLALISYTDGEAALSMAESGLSAYCRRKIGRGEYNNELTKYVATRLGLRTEPERLDARRRVADFLDRVTVQPRDVIVDIGDRGSSIDAAAKRAREVHPRPLLARHDVARHFDQSVLLVAESGYHVGELGPLYDELLRRNVKARFMLAPPTNDQAVLAIGAYTNLILPFDADLAEHAAAIVVLNDWGKMRPVLERATSLGIPTFAKVEGVQDFNDADTGRARYAYRTASIILGQGANDAKALADKHVEIVGNSRLERIWMEQPVMPGEHALINLNFTYNVLTSARECWLGSIKTGLAIASRDAVISCHPAERTRPAGFAITKKPFRHEITLAGVLISRFSTVPFEAIARGVPFVYHNPHGEQVPTFTQPLDAYRITTDADELADALAEAAKWRGSYRERAGEFFRQQIDVDAGRTSAERTADIIISHIAN